MIVQDQELELLEAQFTRNSRDHIIKFRVDDKEKEAIDKMAKALGTNVSSMFRYIAKIAYIEMVDDPAVGVPQAKLRFRTT